MSDDSNEESEILVSYLAPWDYATVLEEQFVDMIFTQAVLEHVDDLPSVYQSFRRWLRPGGFMSHEIDFKSHGSASSWNGHWAYPDLLWKMIVGRREYLINREPHSTHTELLRAHGFEVVGSVRIPDTSGIRRGQLARRFRGISDDDLTTSSALVQARSLST